MCSSSSSNSIVVCSSSSSSSNSIVVCSSSSSNSILRTIAQVGRAVAAGTVCKDKVEFWDVTAIYQLALFRQNSSA